MRWLPFGLLALLLVSCQDLAPESSGSPGTRETSGPIGISTTPESEAVQSPVTQTPAPPTLVLNDPDGAVESATSSSTSQPAPETSKISLDHRESLALGSGVTIEVAWDPEVAVPGRAVFEHGEEVITLELDPDEVLELTFSYHAEGRQTDVFWTTTLLAGRDLLAAQPWRKSSSTRGGDVALVWLANGSTAEYLAQVDAASGATVASPVCFFVQADGSFSNGCDPDFVKAAHARGFEVWPAIAGLDADANHLAFRDGEERRSRAALLSGWAVDLGADGINLDIEGFRDEDAGAFTAFVAELAPLVRAWGGVLSYDLIPRTDTWEVSPSELSFWSTAPQRRELAELTDYIVLMAYDQHNRFRPAGPVASPRWVEANLRYLLRYEDPDEILLGIPFYGRVWDPNRLERPRAIGIGALQRLAATGTAAFDSQYGLDKVTLPDGRFLWAETPEGLSHRFDLVEAHGLGGWAAWRLGFDSEEIWAVVGDNRP